MSTGSVFRLIANDGKADRMILATALLRQRITDIISARRNANKQDLTPTLIDLERTHILYVNAHFKPFAAIGYEYSKVKPQSGSPNLGGSVTFSIPQYGDFFYDIVVRTQLSDCQANRQVVPPESQGAGFIGWNDIMGVPLAPGANYQNFVRYCEYPGYRLFKKVSFEVNGNPLDAYDSDTIVMLGKFNVPVNKVIGNDRLVGQQTPLTGYRDLTTGSIYDNDVSIGGSGTVYNTPQGISSWHPNQSSNQVHLFGSGSSTATNYALQNPLYIPPVTGGDTSYFPDNVGGSVTSFTNVSTTTTTKIDLDPTAPTSTATPGLTQGQYGSGYGGNSAAGGVSTGPWQYDFVQEQVSVVNGPQTPKPAQPPLDIWNKLRFWFNDNVRLSVASVSIPFGQRFITIDLESPENLVYEVPSLFATYGQLNSGVSNGRVLQTVPYYSQAGVEGYTGAGFDVSNIEMYINNIFVNPEIHDIYIKRIGFSLIRVYRKQFQRQTVDNGDILLSQLKWPIEYLYVGFRPKFNTTNPTSSGGASVGGNWETWHDWHRMTKQLPSYTPTRTGACWGATSTDALVGLTTSWSAQNADIKYLTPVTTINNLSLTSHGIVIFDAFRDKFYNAYTPFNYGEYALNTPDDLGAYMINMSLFPRAYQPSGHLNLSRARETYVAYTSSYISSSTPVDFIAIAVAINFLLVSDGSAVLRYST
jgi:hypothetical protein